MAEEKKLDLINSNAEDIKVEQVVQNYLIEPEFLTTNTERAVETLGDVNLPKDENINTDTNTVFNLNSDTESTNNLLQKIPFFQTNVNKINTPANILEKTAEPAYVTKKELSGIISQINGTVNPALQNLYQSVSAIMEKGKDPKGYTEQRPTYNGDMFFFSDELNRTSKKPFWT